MTHRATFRRFAAALATASLLFTQWAIAAYACPGVAPVQASAEAEPPCDGMDSMRPALCHAHCEQGPQSVDKVGAAIVPPAAWVRLAIVSPNIVPERSVPAHDLRSILARTTAPPLAISNCCFRI